MRFITLTVFTALINGAAIAADSFKDIEGQIAQASITKDDDALGNALVQLKSLACTGDRDAARAMGRKYMAGNAEFRKDVSAAYRYLRISADQADPKAAADLVVLLATNNRDDVSIQEAAQWEAIASNLAPEAIESVMARQTLLLAASGMDVTAGRMRAAEWLTRNHALGHEIGKNHCEAWPVL